MHILKHNKFKAIPTNYNLKPIPTNYNGDK